MSLTASRVAFLVTYLAAGSAIDAVVRRRADMRPTRYILVSVVLGMCVAARSQENDRSKSGGHSPVVKETVISSNGAWRRITGQANVFNAYTLRFEDGTEADLRFGMDAPEPGQKGLVGGTPYPCGKDAAEFLAKLIGDKPVAVFDDGPVVPGKKKFRGPCYVGETHLQAEMVRNGWAVSEHSGFDAWEIIARENKRGLWRGQFVVPKNWRKGERLPGEK